MLEASIRIENVQTSPRAGHPPSSQSVNPGPSMRARLLRAGTSRAPAEAGKMPFAGIDLQTRPFHPEPMRYLSRVFSGALFIVGLFAARADWPEFRGPFGDGHVSKDDRPV